MPTKNKRRDVKMSLIELQQALRYGLSLEEAKSAKQLDTPPEKIAHAKSTKLYKTIQKKLGERNVVANLAYNMLMALKFQKQSIVNWSYGMLMALKKKKYAGSPDDKITNPLAIDNNCCKPLYTNIEEKRIAFELSVEDGMNAYTGSGECIPLGGPGAELNDVEYIAGLWVVQNKKLFDSVNVQERDFVLLDRLDRKEHTHFEFYSAASVNLGRYGLACSLKDKDYIVSKYETGRGTFYAYGCQLLDGKPKALATARAQLAEQVYIAYKDLIIADTSRAQKTKKKSPKKEDLYQNKYEIVSVDIQDIKQPQSNSQQPDRQFVLLEHLNLTENTNMKDIVKETGFEFYSASSVYYDGARSSLDPDFIIARCETGRGTFYAYGCKITDKDPFATASAHLAVRVYDAYQDMIEADTRRVFGNQK